MKFPLWGIYNAYADQSDLKQKQPVTLFLLVEGLPYKVRNAHIFCESGKTHRCTHDNALLRDEGRDVVTTHHPTVDHAYKEACYA